MPVYRLAPIDIRKDDEKGAASSLKEAVWVEARDDLDARNLLETATLKMMDFKPGQQLILSPWLDDVVTSCILDQETEAPPEGHMRTADGKLVKLLP